jgi:AraC family transcriptional regulator
VDPVPPIDPRVEANDAKRRPDVYRPVIPGVQVVREGRVEPFLHACPTSSSSAVQWRGLAVENYRIAACVIPHHEHLENFLHVVLNGAVRYEVLTRGKRLRLTAQPGTTFVLPQGTTDELRWAGPTRRVAVAVHQSLLVQALDETAGDTQVELTEHWNAIDRDLMALLVAMTTDLDEGSPAGRLYGESLSNALAVYLLSRYAVRPRVPKVFKGELQRYRLNRVLEYIRGNLTENLGLSELAAVAGMSPHYFCELFGRTMGCPPYRFVLLKRIEFAKELLRNPTRSVLEVSIAVGFQNPSHFSRMFHRFVGMTPSKFQLYHSMTRGRRRTLVPG